MAQKLKKILLALSPTVFLIIAIMTLSLCMSRKSFATDYTADANCQGAWLMDTDNDPVPDSSQNSNTAAHVGNPTHATATPPAAYSSGYYTLDGTNDYFDLSAPAELDVGTGDFSVIMWIRSSNTYARMSLFINGRTGAGGNRYFFFNQVDNDLFAEIDDDETRSDIDGTDIVIDGTWHHVALIADRDGNGLFYVDGGSESTTDISASEKTLDETSNDAAYIGEENPGASRRWNGDLTQVAVFDRILDSTEVNDIMDNGLAAAAPARRVIMISKG